MQVGRALIGLRGAKSREEVAKALGISVSALTMYELGRRTPRDGMKEKIAAYYETCVGRLFFCNEQHETCCYK